jgi:peptidoglycan/LPS O-acetylase OafA/YrhL
MTHPDASLAVLDPGPPGTSAHRSNGFDLLRLVAAITVMYGHAFYLAGAITQEPGYFGNEVATLAVKTFFIISGFLVAQSWIADPRLPAFALRRALRILPGLAVAVLFTMLAIGPLLTQLSFVDYITEPGTWLYLWNIALYPIYDLPGLFASTPYPATVNGSLWTIPAEVLMYVTVPVLIWCGPRKARIAVVVVAILFAVLGVYYVRVTPITPPVVFYGSSLASVLEVAPYFFSGSLYAIFGLHRFSRPVLATVLFVGAALTLHSYVFCECALILLLPFVVISLGVRHFPVIDKLFARGDYSYGIYLYAFPVQQACFVLAHNHLTPLQDFLMSLPVVICLAVASWFLVERNALALKPRRAGSSRKAAQPALKS